MAEATNKDESRSLREIFYIQIGLLLLLAGLAGIDYVFEKVDVGSFFFAIILGALGASISLLRRVLEKKSPLISNHDNLQVLKTLIPILYGTVLAGFAYLLFLSGILSGDGGNGLLSSNLFPNFTKSNVLGCSGDMSLLDEFKCLNPNGIQNAGKLLVWCFLAGYSESFVIGILKRLESHSSAANED